MLCPRGLAGWLSAMLGYPIYRLCGGIREAKLLYRGISTPLTGDNAAASVGESPPAGQRGVNKALLCLAAAMSALMLAGEVMALPFGAIGVLAPT